MSEKIKIDGVDAVAWDLDGTLIDSFDLYVQVISEMAEKRGHTLPEMDELQKNYHGSLANTLSWAFGVEKPDDIELVINEFIDIQHEHYEHDVNHHFFPDAVKLAHLADEQKMMQVVVTNRDHEGRKNASPRSIIQRSAIAEFIHDVRCGDEVIARKPDPRSLEDWHVEEVLENNEQKIVIVKSLDDVEITR
jgi:phosphoglycolate phosphatase-like HAD superfamily hydrolase